jgi:hypothetical protein
MDEIINTIQVSVQSAEITLVGKNAVPNLVIHGSLMNIARGNMVLTLKSGDYEHVGAIGVVEIEKNRPVMQAQASLGLKQFDLIFSFLQHRPPRPVTLILALQNSLEITSEGYLVAHSQESSLISDLSWIIPVL